MPASCSVTPSPPLRPLLLSPRQQHRAPPRPLPPSHPSLSIATSVPLSQSPPVLLLPHLASMPPLATILSLYSRCCSSLRPSNPHRRSPSLLHSHLHHRSSLHPSHFFPDPKSLSNNEGWVTADGKKDEVAAKKEAANCAALSRQRLMPQALKSANPGSKIAIEMLASTMRWENRRFKPPSSSFAVGSLGRAPLVKDFLSCLAWLYIASRQAHTHSGPNCPHFLAPSSSLIFSRCGRRLGKFAVFGILLAFLVRTLSTMLLVRLFLQLQRIIALSFLGNLFPRRLVLS